MRTTTRLRQMLNAPGIIVAPGAYDGFSARLIEAAGFEVVPVSDAREFSAGDAHSTREMLAAFADRGMGRDLLAELSPDHFDSDLHRRAREHLLEPGEADRDLIQLLAELDARAATEGIDEETAKELLLRLREREVRRELATADLERTKELQEQLETIRATAANLA